MTNIKDGDIEIPLATSFVDSWFLFLQSSSADGALAQVGPAHSLGLAHWRVRPLLQVPEEPFYACSLCLWKPLVMPSRLPVVCEPKGFPKPLGCATLLFSSGVQDSWRWSIDCKLCGAGTLSVLLSVEFPELSWCVEGAQSLVCRGPVWCSCCCLPLLVAAWWSYVWCHSLEPLGVTSHIRQLNCCKGQRVSVCVEEACKMGCMWNCMVLFRQAVGP